MMSLILERVIYVSDATRPDPALITLADILATSDRNNRRDHLTGALLVTSTRFLQVLEGARQDLDRTLARLAGDSRHHNLVVLSRHAADQRRFAGWAMAAARITPSQSLHMDAIINQAATAPGAAVTAVQSLIDAQKAGR